MSGGLYRKCYRTENDERLRSKLALLVCFLSSPASETGFGVQLVGFPGGAADAGATGVFRVRVPGPRDSDDLFPKDVAVR